MQKTIYRHYKGGLYEFICEALLESDPSIKMIVYKPLYKLAGDIPEGTVWVRPSSVFFEEIEIDGKRIKRFEKVPD